MACPPDEIHTEFIRAFNIRSRHCARSHRVLQVLAQQSPHDRDNVRFLHPCIEGKPMQCFVYASRRKPDTYLWLAERDGFGGLPEPLRDMLGVLRFALELQLDETRRLPREDARQVLAHLRERGWHLQLPPESALAGVNHPAYGATLHDAKRD